MPLAVSLPIRQPPCPKSSTVLVAGERRLSSLRADHDPEFMANPTVTRWKTGLRRDASGGDLRFSTADSGRPGLAVRAIEYFGLASRTEFWMAVTVLMLGTVFKFWNLFLLRFDSDEPQHLHVVWAWTRGLVQYRDVFDNHMPLFHLLCAPIVGLMGEHAPVLYWMRLLMVPLYVVSLWCIYRIGAIAFSRRVGLWSMLLASAISVYHFCSTEFRTDDAWAVLWFLCLTVLVRDPFAVRSFMVAGLLLGLAFGVSMKTTLMLVTLVSAFGIAIVLVGAGRLGFTFRAIALRAAVWVAPMVVVPLVIIGFFAAAGVWPQFQYCVFIHNVEPPTLKIYLKPLIFITGTPILIYATRKFIAKLPDAGVAFRQAFIAITCGMYFLWLQGFWRHLTRENYLPLFPLVALVSVVLLSRTSELLIATKQLPSLLVRGSLPAICTALVMLFDLGLRLPLTNEAAKEINRVRDVLALTRPNDRVFDCKGESVFRMRSVRYVIETITSGQIERGEIPDELQPQLPELRARVAVVGGEIPEIDERFIEQNYLPVGHGVLVAGSRLKADADGANFRFQITIPDNYEVITPNGLVPGTLDGLPVQGATFLRPGQHTFVPTVPEGPLAVLWAQAVERHFTDFVSAPSLSPVYRKTPVKPGGVPIVDIRTEIPDPFFRPITLRRRSHSPSH